MIGWHYTAYNNWLSIQKEGFVPYPISKPEINEYFPEGVKGIWVWTERPMGESELGSILFQTATKQSTHIVLLEFEYDSESILKWQGRRVLLKHDGTMGGWLYHEKQEALIITHPIPVDKIRLVKDVNLMDLVPPDLGIVASDETVTDENIS